MYKAFEDFKFLKANTCLQCLIQRQESRLGVCCEEWGREEMKLELELQLEDSAGGAGRLYAASYLNQPPVLAIAADAPTIAIRPVLRLRHGRYIGTRVLISLVEDGDRDGERVGAINSRA